MSVIARKGWLLVPGADPVAWAKRHGLEPPTDLACFACGAPQTLSVPFAWRNLRGLVAPACECGHPTPPYCVVAASLEEMFAE